MAIPLGAWLAANHTVLEERSFLPWLAVIVACTLLGAPIFAALAALKSGPRLIVEINDFSRVPDSVAFLEKSGLGE